MANRNDDGLNWLLICVLGVMVLTVIPFLFLRDWLAEMRKKHFTAEQRRWWLAMGVGVAALFLIGLVILVAHSR